jgi:hypothetical protein
MHNRVLTAASAQFVSHCRQGWEDIGAFKVDGRVYWMSMD